ncbi:MAG: carboxymuconolactone decarboxylase family protein [Polyangiales bacterium]
MRIQPAVPPYAERVQQQLDRTMPEGVPPLVLFRVLARNERLFRRFFAGALLGPGALSLRERELIILRTCARNGSEYEWGVHATLFGVEAGFDDAQLRATVHDGAEAVCWSARDRLLVQLADVLAEGTRVPDALWAALSGQFDDDALLELLMLTGLYRMVSTLTNALELPLEPGVARFP